MPSAAERGSSSHGHMHSSQCSAGRGDSRARWAVPPRPLQRRAALRPAPRAGAGGRPASAKARPTQAASAPPPDLDEHAVEIGAGLDAHLPADRPAGVERERVLRALDAEGDGAAADRLAEPVDARVAGRVAVARGGTP